MHGGSKMAVWGSKMDFSGRVTLEHRGNSSSRCSTSLFLGRHGLGQIWPVLSLPHRQEGLQLEFEAQKQVELPSKVLQIGKTGLAYFLPQYVVNIYVLSNFPLHIVLYIVSAINGRFLLDFHHFCSLRVILATNLVSDLFYKFPFNFFSLILSCIIFFMSFSTQDQINYIWQQRHLCSSNQSKIWKYQLTAQHKLWKSKSAKSNVKREKC